MNNKEKCFVFYERWYTQLQRLPPEEKLKMYEAICKYAFGLETEEMAYYLESLMDNIRMSIDENKIRQEDFTEKRKKAAYIRWKNKKTTNTDVMQNNAEQCNKTDNNANECTCMQMDTDVMQSNAKQCRAIQSNAEQYNNKNKNKNKNKKDDDDDESSSIEPSSSSPTSKEDDFSFLRNEVDDLRHDNSWLEIVAMQFHLTKIDVVQKTNDFETNCIMNGQKSHNGTADVKTHFCNWLRINLRQNNHANNYTRISQDELERQKRDTEFAEYAREKMLSDDKTNELPFSAQDG